MKSNNDQDTAYNSESDSADTFQTKTNLKLCCRPMIVVQLCLFAVIVLLWLFLHNWYLCVFVFVVMLSSLVFWIVNNSYTLYFTGDRIYLVGKTKKRNYVVYDITASDLIISQTKKQEKNNTCDIKIKRTFFILLSVEKCDEMREYINTHFE